MSGVMIGVDPHKASATIEVRDEREVLLATGRFGADTGGYRAMRRYCRQWPRRTWAVEGANGTGRPLSQRLLSDGEGSWTCRRSWPPASGCSTPAMPARATPTTRTRSCHGRAAHPRAAAAAGRRGPGCAAAWLTAGTSCRRPGADPQLAAPAAPAARRARRRRRRETASVLVQGPGAAGHRAPAGPVRPHPPSARRRPGRRARGCRPQAEGPDQAADRRGDRVRVWAAGGLRDRPGRGRPDPRRRR